MDNEERDNLRCQIPDSTAEGLAEWLHGGMVIRKAFLAFRVFSFESAAAGKLIQQKILS